MKNHILSVGIDIGTTTSQVIFSELTIENRAVVSRVPQINITDKKIIYRSNIHFTPLKSHNVIDSEKLAQIVRQEYKAANITPKDITVGAVIITGESSRKENSQEVVHALGELAGDFVVASAGPDLEGIIAGRGSGAALLSQEKKCIVANIDIGGGTSNIAIFDDGTPIDTACLDIGGRQVRFESGTLKVAYIAPKTKKICEKYNLSIQEGQIASPSDLEELCKRYVDLLLQGLRIKEPTIDLELILTDHYLKHTHRLSYVMISGGVADAVYKDTSLVNPFEYNDIGILLGRLIQQNFTVPLAEAQETIRATVIGAGAFTASLSGSTVHILSDKLPIKNLPVIKFSAVEETSPNIKLIETIQQKIAWNTESLEKGIVLGFEFKNGLSYIQLLEFSKVIHQISDKCHGLLVIVIENDLAKALGQILQEKIHKPFMVLDSIKLQDGDFMDIGTPLHTGNVVPVVVKSLIFNK